MNAALEKLQYALASAQTLSERIDAMNALALGWLPVNIERARQLAVEAKALCSSSDVAHWSGRAAALLVISRCDCVQSRYQDALENADEALKLAEDLADPKGQADALVAISNVYHRTSNYDLAAENDKKCLALYEEIGDERGIAQILRNSANIFLRSLGDSTQALEQCYKSLHLFEKIGDRYEVGLGLLAIGHAHARADEYTQALEYFMRSYAVFEEFGYDYDMSNVLTAIGTAYSHLGDYVPALEYFEKSLAVRKSMDDRHGSSLTLMSIGNIYLLLGDYGQALERYLHCLSVCEEVNDRRGISNVLGNIGVLYCRMGDYDRGLEYQFREMTIREESGYKGSEVLTNIARTYIALEDIDNALVYGLKGLESCRELGMKHGEAHALEVLGMVYDAMDNSDRAYEYHCESLKIRQTIGDRLGEVYSIGTLGRCCVQLGKLTEAKEYLSTALAMAEDMNIKPTMYDVHANLAHVYEKEGDFVEALLHYKQYHQLEEEVNSEEVARHTKNLQAMHQLEESRKEAEIYRLKNVELAEANTRLEQANHELKEINNEKNEFLGIVSHDLKNPLLNISLLAELLQENTEHLSVEEVREYSADIQTVSKRMFELIKNLLDINAIETRGVVCHSLEFDVVPVVNGVAEMYRERAGQKEIELHMAEEKEMKKVYADMQIMVQVMDNLISNAVKYSPKGKQIWMRVYKVESAEAAERESLEKRSVRIEVKDEGPGINAEDMKKLFGKFARLTAQPTGGEYSTGLGLSIVKRLVEAMHGHVWCESEPGKGAAFTVELPSVEQRK